MGFFTGRVTFLRFRIDGPAPVIFGPPHLEKLAEHAIGQQKTAEKDGTEAGWIASDDILDIGFDLAKNITHDALHWCLRIDTQKLPADLLRSYTRTELQALAATNPNGRPSAFQKKQAREIAREKLEVEAQDGRYRKRKAYPVLWDRPSNSLLVGTASPPVLVRVQQLFKETFGCGLLLVDATHCALTVRHADSLLSLRPAAFVPSTGAAEVAWVKDPASHNYLGNEFLLWLWFVLEAEGDTLLLKDGSQTTLMLARTLVLECPKAQSGNETIRSEAPTKLPEARRAVQSGKLPRQVGLIVVRHDEQYELTLQAETLLISGAKLPSIDGAEERVRREERMGQLRHLIETVDLLYAAFLDRRLSADWAKKLERMQQWLRREEQNQLAAAG